MNAIYDAAGFFFIGIPVFIVTVYILDRFLGGRRPGLARFIKDFFQ